MEPRITKTAEIDAALEASDLDILDYDKRWGRYKIRLQKSDLTKHADVLRQVLETSYREFGGGEP
jgi:hypothetical protein